jgi:hypothetical protein
MEFVRSQTRTPPFVNWDQELEERRLKISRQSCKVSHSLCAPLAIFTYWKAYTLVTGDWESLSLHDTEGHSYQDQLQAWRPTSKVCLY